MGDTAVPIGTSEPSSPISSRGPSNSASNASLKGASKTVPSTDDSALANQPASANSAANPPTAENALDMDEDDDSAGYEESAERDEIIRERINRTLDQMRTVVDNLSEEQTKRYERFRRVGFSRSVMEKLMHRILDQRVHTSNVIVATGIAKVFVGELVETARQVMEEEIRAQMCSGLEDAEALEDEILGKMANKPLEPFHILEAHRRMKLESSTSPHSHLYTKPSPF